MKSRYSLNDTRIPGRQSPRERLGKIEGRTHVSEFCDIVDSFCGNSIHYTMSEVKSYHASEGEIDSVPVQMALASLLPMALAAGFHVTSYDARLQGTFGFA